LIERHLDKMSRAASLRPEPGDVLCLEISDDGVGGADPTGSGLRGLRGRVEALDGPFRVLSPAGGPTTLSAELPCEW
jgi:signal transduction histidine kinase